MTLLEFSERIMVLPKAGFLTDENIFDRKYIYSLIHSASAQAKRNEFLRTKKIHNTWYFPYYPEYDSKAQADPCFNRYKLPQTIALDARQTGLGFVGSLKFNKEFRVTIGRAKFAAEQNDRVMKVRSGRTHVMIDNDYMEVYGDTKNFMMEGCWFDVTELPNYNIEKDNYPIEASLIPEVEKIILQTDMVIITKSAIDRLQNKQDDSVVRK